MSDQKEYAWIDWRGGNVPISTGFDDPYFSLEDGLAETRHVFLRGNDLPDRFAPGFHIAELGFGSGLNLLCAWQAWLVSGHTTPLYFTSFEAFPLHPDDMMKTHAVWPELADIARGFYDIWDPKIGMAHTDTLQAQVIYGDARKTLPCWEGKADAWFLDGFSPAKNPELWGEDLMQAVADHTVPNGTIATYSAAGHVRQGLAKAGFEVTRTKGFGRKRHMTRGTLKAD